MRVAILCALLAVGQPPVEDVPPPPLPPPDEATTAVQPVDWTLRRITLGGDIGTVFGGWGMWRAGTLSPTRPFAHRPQLFPIPTADYAHDVKYNLSLAARVQAAYTFEYLPLTATGSWETYHRHAETLLLGYNRDVAPLLGGLNDYNERVRRPDQNWGGAGGDLLTGWAGNNNEAGGNHRDFPRLQMRTVPSEQHRLTSRVTANVADFTLAYKVWTPREAKGVEYRVLAGGRFGGFFADDAAVNPTHEQSASNWYGGFGPHGGVRIDYRLGKREDSDPAEFRFWGEARGGALYGEITQRFRELDRLSADPYRELVLRDNRTVPFLATELGFGVFGPRGGWLTVGVRYSHYWGIGNVGNSQLNFAAVAGFLGLGFGF